MKSPSRETGCALIDVQSFVGLETEKDRYDRTLGTCIDNLVRDIPFGYTVASSRPLSLPRLLTHLCRPVAGGRGIPGSRRRPQQTESTKAYSIGRHQDQKRHLSRI